MTSRSTTSIDGQWFRRVLGSYPTGVTVITAIGEDGRPAGMAVGSFTSVSLDPPLVAFLPDKSSSSFPKIRTASSFCVNVLAADQEQVCRAMATKGGDKFANVSWSPTASGAPRIDGVAAWIDCEFESITEAGDHYLVMGRVTELDTAGELLPLVFFQGGYGRFSPSSLVAVPEADFVSHLRLAERCRSEMEKVAAEIGTECLAIAPVDDQLVVLASAGAPSGGAEFTWVGQRMPFVPPFGAPLVASAGDDAVRAWLDRSADVLTEQERERQLELLGRVRERGWSLSLGEDDKTTHDELLDAIDRYSGGDRESRGHVKRLGGVLARHFEPAEDLDPALTYDVRLLSVPVVGPDGAVPLTLTLWGLPRPSTGGDVQRYLDVTRSAAQAIAKSLSDQPIT